MLIEKNTVIIGAGIAGLGAAHSLIAKGENPLVLEKDKTFGGLCGNFEINGFRFDRFVHLSFSKYDQVNELFWKSAGVVNKHIPNPYNIYNKIWIKHPAQNNLFPLSDEEKKLIVDDFLSRPTINDNNKPRNYEEWLRFQYGDYFAEHFPMVYTRKYWMKEAKDLRTEWTGGRFYQPSVDEVLKGCKTSDTPVTYYAKEQFYPAKGGFKSFFKLLAEESDVMYDFEVNHIDVENKVLSDKHGNMIKFNRLISSMPLPEIIEKIDKVPESVTNAVAKLEATSGYHISIALRTENIPPYLWWYIYDEDILSARVYSPSLKSADNAPFGCSSLQMEVYCKEGDYSEKQLLDGTVGKLIQYKIINEDDILFTHIGFEKYANIIFSEPIYVARKIVRDYLSSIGIETIGRFGEWDYLWSDQALRSGLSIK